MPAMPSTRTLSRTALGATLFLIMLGGFTRGSGSGFGCADRWPLCENGLLGGLLPRFEYHMIIEWSHRWVAAIVGVLIVATAWQAWRDRPRNPHAAWPAAAAILVVGIQAWLGRMVVKGDLDRDLVAVHLSVSITIAALLALVVVATRPVPATRAGRGHIAALALGAATAYATLLLGSLVHNLFFDGWPVMQAGMVPDLSNRFVAFHWLHRMVAGVGLVLVIWLEIRSRRRPERWLVSAAAAGYLVNVTLGAIHVFTEVTSALVVALHLGVAALTWTALVGATAVAADWGQPPAAED